MSSSTNGSHERLTGRSCSFALAWVAGSLGQVFDVDIFAAGYSPISTITRNTQTGQPMGENRSLFCANAAWALLDEAAGTPRSSSDIVNDAVQEASRDDQEDPATYNKRVANPATTHTSLPDVLRSRGTIWPTVQEAGLQDLRAIPL